VINDNPDLDDNNIGALGQLALLQMVSNVVNKEAKAKRKKANKIANKKANKKRVIGHVSLKGKHRPNVSSKAAIGYNDNLNPNFELSPTQVSENNTLYIPKTAKAIKKATKKANKKTVYDHDF
jgi:hypothetical protein